MNTPVADRPSITSTAALAYDGVVALSDQLALGVMNRLFERGTRVPDQVRIIGIDDSPACESAIVPLTSVCEHYEPRGQKAVEMINQLLAKQHVESITVPPTIRPRTSA